MKVLLVEDDEALRETWVGELEAAAEHVERDVSIVAEPDIREFVTRLETRREEARARPQEAAYEGDHADDADLLIVDYDLTLASVALTGRRVSYLARCYSGCGVIMLLNERGDNWYDLRLQGDVDSFAQIAVGGRQLSNPGLWRGGGTAGFRPWQWPVLTTAVDDLAACIEIVAQDLNAPAMEVIGLPSSVLDAMPRSVVEVLWTEGDLRSASFFDLSSALLRRKDELGVAGRARLVAAQLASWLELVVLPGQNVLVDAPHLVSRFPSLLLGSHDDLSAWDRTADLSLTAEELGVDVGPLAGAQLEAKSWLSRPAWFWPMVSEDSAIEEVRDPWTSRSAPFVFAEDLSRFQPAETVRPFVSDVDSPFVRRFARGPVGEDPLGSAVQYLPPQRFA